eukprot:CAMPEP_0194553728 /NCGR_PEP_ID=MMETSP0253-20130528/97377_1 /TAXON_ID=2966 /ORGANISM="Noctiluca scintillans" /LENGTH=50 /DNA_ID=CAMNT_0039401209 /DNA_START=556 /DNA_END=708 /DNA_ORIENTATION=-
MQLEFAAELMVVVPFMGHVHGPMPRSVKTSTSPAAERSTSDLPPAVSGYS